MLVLVLDLLTAFQIIREIQIAKETAKQAVKGITQSPLLWDLGSVLPDSRFWLLILTGFGSYFMLGFIFDFFISIHDKAAEIRHRIAEIRKGIKQQIDAKRSEVEQIRQDTYSLERGVNESHRKIEIIKKQIEHLNEHLNVDPKLVRHDVVHCIEGWLVYIYEDSDHSPGSLRYKSDLSQKCREKMDEFFLKINSNYGQSAGGDGR